MILIVDDDPLRAHLAISLLGKQFGELDRANDASEALCLIEQPAFAAKLRLVITGHNTKGIGGPAFVAELTERMPALSVVVLGESGESPSEYTGEHVAFLPQPLIAQQLVLYTRRMLALQKLQIS
jgi:DNA-binding NtrC family response regulator